MNWQRTKSIFILTFLVLNLFLGYQLYQKNDINNISRLTDQPLEERLANNEISLSEKLPKYKEKQTLISAQRYKFSEEEKKSPAKNVSLDKEASTDITLHYDLSKPMNLPKKDSKDLISELTQFAEENISRGKEYAFYEWDKENNTVWFTQVYQEKRIFYNPSNFGIVADAKDYDVPNGMIRFKLDDKGNLTNLTQTYLFITRQGAFQQIISPSKALEKLLESNLQKGDHIQKVELGHYSLVGEGEVQVYTPTWFIETKNGQYLVNATDSSIQVLTEKAE
ncbi:two-component system regulatory protein YycI [Fictibacillus nanhaiensis]|uniref:two-component system regulatory protein YycI n=1 Tax=Fictibacillus nanhaiensis TaxID=742169 RepID=UPI002E1C6787|nr:two-component system regulatory protein YycI [Fictibacillus nanhaiensis]MED1865013.1 two-component system regulatory protein YycI [Fictibacillus nanhaiensis]